MGWSYGWYERKELINYLTDSSKNGERRSDCIAHCYRGNPYRGVLWSVWVISHQPDPTVPPTVTDRYIRCDLLAYDNRSGEWGYKDMDESSHPFYYSCPLSYLDMAPVACEEWRKKVREHHAKSKRKIKVGTMYKTIPGVKLGKKEVAYITVQSLKPIRGTVMFEGGGTIPNVKFQKKHLAEEVV